MWIEYENNRISDPTWFHSSDQTSSQYLQNGYRGYSVNSRLKTDASTWHPCYVKGNIYP